MDAPTQFTVHVERRVSASASARYPGWAVLALALLALLAAALFTVGQVHAAAATPAAEAAGRLQRDVATDRNPTSFHQRSVIKAPKQEADSQ